MSDEDFNTVMARGLAQAKADNSKLAKEVFADLRKRDQLEQLSNIDMEED